MFDTLQSATKRDRIILTMDEARQTDIITKLSCGRLRRRFGNVYNKWSHIVA